MSKIRIRTTQNIDIEYELGTIFDRMLAWLIDFILIVGYMVVAYIIAAAVEDNPEPQTYQFWAAPALFYHFFSEWWMGGQSVGKMALRIKVVRLDGSPPTVVNYFSRWVFRVLETNPVLMYGAVSVFAIAFNENGQRVGDMVAGTVVIKTNSNVTMADTILAKTKEGYEALFPSVTRLKDRDIATIKDVLRIYRREANLRLLNACANRVCHALSVVPPQDMSAEQFLRSVVRDYSHLS
ncbi:MAG: RDD family protein [Bacteroidota bacterium]